MVHKVIKLTTYDYIGKVIVNSRELARAGSLENLRKGMGVIVDAYEGRYARPCRDGTPAPDGLNLTIKDDFLGVAGLTFTATDDIAFVRDTLDPEKSGLLGKRITTYNNRDNLAGIGPCE